MIKKLFFILTFWCCFAELCLAQNHEINLGKINVKQLEEIYAFYDYKGERGYLQLPDYYYPPILLSSLPSDFAKITDENIRNPLFFKILAPLALKINKEIKAERQEIEKLYEVFQTQNELNDKQTTFLEDKATKYDIFTRLKGHQRQTLLFKELLVRVDDIPPSFLIANAAIATNYGTSRAAQIGNNALFKEFIWHEPNQGLKPIGETEDDSYRIQTFPNLYASMYAFALKLNANIKFEHMRGFRKDLRYRNSYLTGTTFAYSLLWNLPLKNYAGMLEYTIAFYELNIIDKSLLNSKLVEKPLPPKFKPFLQK